MDCLNSSSEEAATATAGLPAGRIGSSSSAEEVEGIASLLLQVFKEWRAGIWGELKAYQARGHTLLDFIWTVLLCLLVEFHLELLLWGRTAWQNWNKPAAKTYQLTEEEQSQTTCAHSRAAFFTPPSSPASKSGPRSLSSNQGVLPWLDTKVSSPPRLVATTEKDAEEKVIFDMSPESPTIISPKGSLKPSPPSLKEGNVSSPLRILSHGAAKKSPFQSRCPPSPPRISQVASVPTRNEQGGVLPKSPFQNRSPTRTTPKATITRGIFSGISSSPGTTSSPTSSPKIPSNFRHSLRQSQTAPLLIPIPSESASDPPSAHDRGEPRVAALETQGEAQLVQPERQDTDQPITFPNSPSSNKCTNPNAPPSPPHSRSTITAQLQLQPQPHPPPHDHNILYPQEIPPIHLPDDTTNTETQQEESIETARDLQQSHQDQQLAISNQTETRRGHQQHSNSSPTMESGLQQLQDQSLSSHQHRLQDQSLSSHHPSDNSSRMPGSIRVQNNIEGIDDHLELDLDLEQVALALKAGVNFVTVKKRGRRLIKKKRYDNCFSGSAAVDFLTQYLKKPRAEALIVGRQIHHEYNNLWLKCGSKKRKKFKKMSSSNNGDSNQSMMDDSDTDYGDLNSSAGSISFSYAASEEHMHQQRLSSSLLRDSRSAYYRFFAFLPSEVAEMPVERKMHLFEAGVRIKDRRRGLKKKYKDSFRGKDAVNFLVRSGLTRSRQEAILLGNRFITEFNMFEPLNRIDSFQDSGDFLYRFVGKNLRYFNIDNDFSTRLVEFQGNDVDWTSTYGGDGDGDLDDPYDTAFPRLSSISQRLEPIESESESESEFVEEVEDAKVHELHIQDYQHLCEVAEILERGIKLKKHGAFVASRAVTFLVSSGLSDSRPEAEDLGRRLEREFNLFQEEHGNHDFGDSNHMFRFTDKAERHYNPMKIQMPFDELAIAFEQGVKVKDYVHNLKTYKRTFVGVKAVDYLVNSGLASNRAEAVRIGRQLVEKFNLFDRVTGNREFCDDYVYFRFTPPEKRCTPELETSDVRRSVNALLTSDNGTAASQHDKDMLELAEKLLTGIKVKENKFRAKSYRQTFVGSETVSFMVNNCLAMSRKEGVELCGLLSKEIGLFRGIDGSQDFKDDYFLYRFEEQFQDFEDQTTLRRGKVSGLKGISGVSVKSLSLEKIAEAFRRGVPVSEHKKYGDTFIGQNAVDFLVGHGLAEDRVAAVDLGRSMAREFDLFVHTKNEHEFKDRKHHYIFCYEGEIRPLEVIELDKALLTEMTKGFIANVKVKEHRMKLLVFNDTFVGSEAVSYLVDSNFASSRKEAVQVGRAIAKEFNLFEHVTLDRKFEDANVLYYFAKEEDWYKGLKFERQFARRNVFMCNDDFNTDDGGLSESSSSVGNFNQNLSSKEDAEKRKLFESKVRAILRPHLMKIQSDDDYETVQRKQRINRFNAWASEFRRLDPRYQIQYFFDCIAQDGANNVENLEYSLATFLLPVRSQVFTVWRPTSLHAIRKMMCGEAVGKGLDIKGKSAKRGKLSGFVPFLQISANKHKGKIRPPSKEGVVRVFYPGEGRRARDIAAEHLERVAEEMIETVEKAKKVLRDKGATEEAKQNALDAMLLDMVDPKILYIDSYAPDRFGFEIPERLFWETYFAREDCSRKPGTEYDTGRPSQPAFQDMNFAAIRNQPRDGAPRACVYQNADPGEPMNPFELLMAYEEHNRVMPVVSDFDCFLVGTEGVSYTSPLAGNQLKVLRWYVSEIEHVVTQSKVGDSWTVRWLDVLKKAAREGIYPEMPRFGFGDPKSYSVMKSAVSQLHQTGAVRHGAECFNYYFPQDMDEEFLVIANDLPDGKPWEYMDQVGLLEFLGQKVNQGFTFPLNPKWILCDAGGWYDLYNKLLKSEDEMTKKSMDIWFPPESGLRVQIERIHNSRPEGFYAEPISDDDGSGAGNSAAHSFKSSRKSTIKGKQDTISRFAVDIFFGEGEDDNNNALDGSAASSLIQQPKKNGARKKAKKVLGKLLGNSPKKSNQRSDDTMADDSKATRASQVTKRYSSATNSPSKKTKTDKRISRNI